MYPDCFRSCALRQIIEKRIGLEMFSDKLSQISKHESYSTASKRPQITQQYSSDILFDYQFTRLVKKLESEYTHTPRGWKRGKGVGGGISYTQLLNVYVYRHDA